MKNTFQTKAIGLSFIAIATLMCNCSSPDSTESEALATTDTVYIHDTVYVEKSPTTEKPTTPDAKKPLAGPEANIPPKKVPLTLIIENLASKTAPVVVGLYKSKVNFLDVKGRVKEYKFTPKGSNILKATITDMNYGDFAMAIYQDENSNGEIDKNFIGVPKEGYAFSNNYKPRVKAPSFDNCRFVYNEKSNTVTMKMIR